ncbi:MAG: NAD(P) transhydrogenase subunit alpha [Pirellulaceae bacterium]|jgi:NAD(P) transhydrogenase subunit alpha|nr:NAD(P) transhydrogenase subunit alpha [Pirellulaceae bacterium]
MDCLKNSFAILLCLGAVSWASSPCSADGPDDSAERPPIAATAGDAGGVSIKSGPGSSADSGFTDAQITGLIASLTIFVLAIFVGFEVITKVPPTLHTPLMSGSNAISGITMVGAIVAAGAGGELLATLLGTIAVALATINVVGGFLVTHRMLQMFRKR